MGHLETRPTALISVGKAAAGMARAAREAGCDVPGIIVTTDENFAAIEACVHAPRHPVPDERGLAAAKAVMEMALCGEDDHLLLLIAWWFGAVAAPADGMTLADKQALNEALLASGLDIRRSARRAGAFAAPPGSRSSFCPMSRVTCSIHRQWPGDRGPGALDQALALIRDAGLDSCPS